MEKCGAIFPITFNDCGGIFPALNFKPPPPPHPMYTPLESYEKSHFSTGAEHLFIYPKGDCALIFGMYKWLAGAYKSSTSHTDQQQKLPKKVPKRTKLAHYECPQEIWKGGIPIPFQISSRGWCECQRVCTHVGKWTKKTWDEAQREFQ